MGKRENYITWDQYFMGLAKLSAERSKDPNTQVGACIVNHDNRVLSVGYNGAPVGFADDRLPWERIGSFQETKYAYVCHAEMNAILNFHGNLRGTKLYVTLFPCNECAKAIIQAGIKEIVYLSDKYCDSDETQVSKRLLETCGVTYKQYEKSDKKIELEL